MLTAFNPATGAKLWSVTLPGQSSFTSLPTFAGGVVYTGGAGSGGTLYAVDAASGAVLWTQSVENGDDSSPAVSAKGVYVSYACEQTYAFDPKSGDPIWHHDTGCEGGGGRTPVLADGGVWIRDDAGMAPAVLKAGTGTVRGTYEAAGTSPAPAFDGRQGYFVDGGVLQERYAGREGMSKRSNSLTDPRPMVKPECSTARNSAGTEAVRRRLTPICGMSGPSVCAGGQIAPRRHRAPEEIASHRTVEFTRPPNCAVRHRGGAVCG